MMDLESAKEYATTMHLGQERMGGNAYITHPLAVAEMIKSYGYDESYVITALFHDLLEDTKATKEAIVAHSSKAVLEAVVLLTKEPEYDMTEYIERIKQNEMAFAVKACDRIHNLKTAVDTPLTFKNRYIKETKGFYIEMVKGTLFEAEMQLALNELIKSLEEKTDADGADK